VAREQRRLAAIVSADVAGYSRLMGRDESGTLAALKALRREVVDPKIAAHAGRIVKTTGDGLLLEFPSVVDAVRCMIEVQTEMVTRVADVPEDRRIAFRIGLHVGDIIIDGDDIFGDGVDIAARLQEIATPGGLCVSGRVHDDVRDRLETVFEDGGAQTLKNIARPVHVWRWSPGASTLGATPVSVGAHLALPDKPSIAVLPFQNMSGDPEQEYFADGMVEDIITALSRMKWLFVIARNSSFAYKGKPPDVRQVGQDLGVRYVLEGSVRKAGNRVRLTGQLIDATTGSHIWADRFDGTVGDVFDLQDQMTGSVVAAIEPKLRMAEVERAQRKPAGNLQAYDLLLRALPKFHSRTRRGLEEADRLLRKAIEIDPEYASAYAQLAWCHWTFVSQGWMDRSNPAVSDLLALARTALALDGEDPEVLSACAPIIALPGEDFSGGMSLIEKAIGLNPNSATAFRTAGMLYAFGGDTRAAIDNLRQADRLNPLEGGVAINIGYTLAHFVAGEHDAVIEWTGKTLRDQANFVPALRYRAASLGLLGRTEEGRRVVQRILDQVPDFTIAKARRHIEYDLNNAFRIQGVADALYEGLRLSGVPEG